MIWAILTLLGVPLWLIALGILVTVLRNRSLRKRVGDIPVRVLRPGKKRWTRGHAVWVSDVFAWRGSPSAWNEGLVHIDGVYLRTADPEERKRLHGLHDDPVVASLTFAGGPLLDVAAKPEHRLALVGPFGQETGRRDPVASSDPTASTNREQSL